MALNNFYFIPFLTVVFLLFLVSSLALKQYACKAKTLQVLLIVASYCFISITNIYYGLILLFTSLIAYFAPIAIEKYENRKVVITKLTIIVLLLILAVFKYYNFFISSFAWFIEIKFTLKLLLPLGISFYIFSAISYIVDIYRKKYSANHSLIEVLLFMAFFPKLLAGPIVRADDFFKQLPCLNAIKWANISTGIQVFAVGLFKKMVLADHLGVFVDDVFYAPVAYDSLTVLWGIISYSLQIYFDFSGYSDMAIGTSKIFGFNFADNFSYPYLSKNVTEFWKRWHISLSSWLQEYLYYSLGGNRNGKIRTHINLFLTMLIGGLWHGAAWTFVVWGALHGLALVFHKLFMQWKQYKFGDKRATTWLWNRFSVVFTWLFTSFCWIFFRATSFENAANVIKAVFSNQIGIVQPYTWTMFALVLTVIAILTVPKKPYQETTYCDYPIQDLATIKGQTIFYTFVGITIILAYLGNTAFIYGNF